jgi:hypothetical protein
MIPRARIAAVVFFSALGSRAEALENPHSPKTPGQPFAVRVHIQSERPTHAISPYIYGASGVSADQAVALGVTTVRWGGNRSSRYDWQAQADNAGADWFFLNGKAGRWTDFVAANQARAIASYVTVPMLPWIAKNSEGWGFSVAKYGPQKRVEPYNADRGDGYRPDGQAIVGNDPRDTSIPSTSAFQADGVRRLPREAGRLPRIYGLDNEMMLWHHTHRDVHPRPVNYDEALRVSLDYARAIKQADPRGLVAGPCAWGWTDLFFSAADEGTDRYATHADHDAHRGEPFLPWYLAAMNRASADAGKRLLDLVDVHVYPQGQGVFSAASNSPATRALRLRSTRSLWDSRYRDESWIKAPVMLIPRLRAWADEEFPGTKLCLGEYNWGGDDDPSGAVAQAEILGIFAREQLDYAYFWAGLKGVQRFAFQLYRNPDGRHLGFGESYLACRSEAPESVSVFAARRNDGALTIVLINKDVDRAAKVTIDLGAHSLGAGTLYRLTNPPGPIRKEAFRTGAAVGLPPLSAALVVGGPSSK